MSANIALHGMMGAGKTTIGRLLADRLGRSLADTDAEVVRWVGRSIPEIFATEGEAAFRGYESAVIRTLATHDDLVIALGGGAVLDDANVADLTLTGILVYLRVDVEVLVARLLAEAGTRPLLAGEDLTARVINLLEERGDRYREVADLIVDGNAPAEAVVEAILAHLRTEPDLLTPSEFEAIIR